MLGGFKQTYHYVNNSRESVEFRRFVAQLLEPQTHPSGEVVAAGELNESISWSVTKVCVAVYGLKPLTPSQ